MAIENTVSSNFYLLSLIVKTRVFSIAAYRVWILHRGSYISAHVLLNLLHKLGKSDKKCEACRAFCPF